MDGRARATPITAVVIPALNEERSLPLVLAAIPRELDPTVIVVDNGSEDQTAEVAAAAGATVIREPRRGYGSACLAGIAALPADVALVVFLDGDFSDHPEDMANVVAPIIAGEADFVVGSRMLQKDARGALLPQARFGNWLASVLMRLMFGIRCTDLGPFRAIRREALDGLQMRDRDFGWTVEMQLRARLRGLRVTEVPVRYRERVGKSKITGTFSGTVRASYKILRTIFAYRIRPPRFEGVR